MFLLREGSKKIFVVKNMVFDHNWGGGVSPNHTLIAKLHFFRNIIYIFYYTQYVVLPQ